MAVVGEVREAVKGIAELVDGTRTIMDALKDGNAYLRRNHPDAQGLLAELLEQMRTTVVGLRQVMRVVTGFDFMMDGTERDRGPRAFNEHIITSGQELDDLEEDMSRLKGSCTRVSELAVRLQERAGATPWWALLGDRAGQRAQELSGELHKLYQRDDALLKRADTVVEAMRAGLASVREELQAGTVGSAMSVQNVERAAVRLHEVAEELRPLEGQLKKLRNEISDQIASLD